MPQFLPHASRLLQKYKMSLRKQLSKDERKKSLTKLQLHTGLPRDEVSLYKAILRVTDHVKSQLQAQYEHIRFSGSKQFLHEMQNLLKGYRLEETRVVHVTQEAAKALLDAIQLMVLPNKKHTKKVAAQLAQHALKIAQYGTKDQQLAFWNSLKKFAEQDEIFFSPILAQYREYLEKHLACNLDIK